MTRIGKGSTWVTVHNATEGAHKFATPPASRVVFSLNSASSSSQTQTNFCGDSGWNSGVVASSFASFVFGRSQLSRQQIRADLRTGFAVRRAAFISSTRQNAYLPTRSSVTKSCCLTSFAARGMSFAVNHLHASLAMRAAAVEAR